MTTNGHEPPTMEQTIDTDNSSELSYWEKAAWYFTQAEEEVLRRAKLREHHMKERPWVEVLETMQVGTLTDIYEGVPEELIHPPIVDLGNLIGMGEFALKMHEAESRNDDYAEAERNRDIRFEYSQLFDALADTYSENLIPDDGYISLDDLIDLLDKNTEITKRYLPKSSIAVDLARHFELDEIDGEWCVPVDSINALFLDDEDEGDEPQGGRDETEVAENH